MFDWSSLLSACRRNLAVAVIVVAALVAASSGAAAQQVVIVVNGDPITAFDIEQRTRFLQLATNKTPPRQEVVDELIEEKLKLQLVKRFDFTNVPLDNQVENMINSMARGNRKAFTEQLASQGVHLGTLKSRLKAQIVWSQVIRGKFQSSLQFNEDEILKAVETRKKDDTRGYDYTLRPIMFVVPRGSPQTSFETRRREAEALRTRFQNCEDGIPFARAMRDVTVRDQVIRSTADLPPALREILEKTEVGKLTPPEVTLQGIEVYALCAKKQSSADNSPAKREAREELYSQQFQASAKRYLKELRSQAYIVYK